MFAEALGNNNYQVLHKLRFNIDYQKDLRDMCYLSNENKCRNPLLKQRYFERLFRSMLLSD